MMIDQEKMDRDIQIFVAQAHMLTAAFNNSAINSDDKEWVKACLQYMVNVEQMAIMHLMDTPQKRGYSPEEEKEFCRVFSPIVIQLTQTHAGTLKSLLRDREWFKISEFGPDAEDNAWFLVQHADCDPSFQKKVLGVLEKLYPLGEVRPAHYAYLYDRVASSLCNPSQQRSERYGTQGLCDASGNWLEVEDPERFSERCKDMELPPMLVERRKNPPSKAVCEWDEALNKARREAYLKTIVLAP